MVGKEAVEQLFGERVLRLQTEPDSELRRCHDDSGGITRSQGQVGGPAFTADRLFPEHCLPIFGETAHEMLRTLEYKIPAQMAEAYQERLSLNASRNKRLRSTRR
jgi:hypothetical protein